MHKMSYSAQAIAGTRTGDWTSKEPCINSEPNADFCINHCPHAKKPCNGDCEEMKAFRKENKRK